MSSSKTDVSEWGTEKGRAERERLRAEWVAKIPRWYSGWAHFAIPTLIGLALIGGALALLRDPRWWELALAVPIWVISNMTEWRAHKGLLHTRTWPLQELWKRHTPQHHRVFVSGDMAVRSTREFRLVLIPGYGVLAIFAITFPVTVALALGGLRNVACVWVATTIAYVVSYEWLHLAYHLPPDGFVGRLALVRVLRRHHETHHWPPLMQRWNFNVTVPLWDWVRGTIYRGPDPAERPEAATQAATAERPAA